VTVQVLTQAREPIIRRTFDAIVGVKRAIVHLYNSTSTTQRRVVFGMDRAGIREIAVKGAALIRECAAARPQTDWVFQYSPESFTATELDFAADVCNAVNDIWQPTPQRKVIINLPSTSSSLHRTSTPIRSNGCRARTRAPRFDRAVRAPAQRPRLRCGFR
jgi:2-isopropylmalate synthase